MAVECSWTITQIICTSLQTPRISYIISTNHAAETYRRDSGSYTNLDKMASAGKQAFGCMSSGRTRNDVLQPFKAPAQLRPSASNNNHVIPFEKLTQATAMRAERRTQTLKKRVHPALQKFKRRNSLQPCLNETSYHIDNLYNNNNTKIYNAHM